MALGSSKLAATTGPPLPPCDAVRDRRTTSAPRAVRAFVAHRPTKPVAPVTSTRTASSSFIPMQVPANILHAATAFVKEKNRPQAERISCIQPKCRDSRPTNRPRAIGRMLSTVGMTSARLSRIRSPRVRLSASELGRTMPRFSLVIPTLQRSDALRHSLATLVNQEYDDFEIVVQNNGRDGAT